MSLTAKLTENAPRSITCSSRRTVNFASDVCALLFDLSVGGGLVLVLI